MSGLGGVLAFIATLFVMLVFHEFGHYITAKRFGFKVEQFFAGVGPTVWSIKRGETEYGVKAFLVAGYVRIAGMNPWQTIPESELPRTFGAKPAWQRAIVLSAGSFTHFILATVVLLALFAFVGVPTNPTTTLDSVQPKVTPPSGFSLASEKGVAGPARAAGLRAGDRVVAVNGVKVSSWEDLRNAIRSHPADSIVVEVLRDGARMEFQVNPVAASGKDPKGNAVTIGLIGIAPQLQIERQSIPAAAWTATKSTGLLIRQSVLVIGKVFSPSGISQIIASLGKTGNRSAEDPVGIVGGARVAGQAASAGATQDLLFTLAGFIVIIGVVNLAPLPPLDGGHLLVLLIEKVRGRKVDMRRVVPVAAAVLGFLIFLQLALLYLDIVRPVTNPFQ